jgi:hypothetical protein
MKKIIAITLSAALVLGSTPSFAFHRKAHVHHAYTPEHVLVVHRENQTLVYIPLITPLWEGLVYPVINGVAIGVVTGTTAVFGGVGYVLTTLTNPPRSCVAQGGALYRC